jgi:hypothetical protein
MIPIWVLVALRWLLAVALCLSILSGALALALSFAGQRQRGLARRLWPVAGVALWSAVCLFMVAVWTNWPGTPAQVPLTRLALPAFLALLGGILGGHWLRWTTKGARPASVRSGVAP